MRSTLINFKQFPLASYGPDMFVCESYVVLDECDESPSLFVSLSVYMVVYFVVSCIVGIMSGYVMCMRFLVPRFSF